MSSTEWTLKQQLDPRSRLRRFGLVMTVASALLGSFLYWRGHDTATVAFVVAALFVVPALVAPTLLGPLERLWMAFARLLQTVMTTLILTLTFFLAITPMGLAVRLFGRDLLSMRLDPERASYWVPVEPDGPASRPRTPY